MGAWRRRNRHACGIHERQRGQPRRARRGRAGSRTRRCPPAAPRPDPAGGRARSRSRCCSRSSATRNSWSIGFDFRGTLWEPARALLDGTPIYPVPEREAVAVGNPAVYPPVFILASVPLALLPAATASWLWFFVLAAGVLASMWILGVRDWRCLVLAVTSPVVVHGLFYGNLTVLLVLPLALAWRYRDRARVAGLRRRRRGRGEAVRLAARRLASPHAALPGGGVGGGVGCRARARGVGADRVRGLPRLSEAAAGGAGRVRGAQRLAVDRRRRARRPGLGRRRGVARSPASSASASPPGSSGGPTATGARSPSSWRHACSPRRSRGRTTPRSSSSRSRSRGRAWRRRGSSGTRLARDSDRSPSSCIDVGPPPAGVLEQAWLGESLGARSLVRGRMSGWWSRRLRCGAYPASA